MPGTSANNPSKKNLNKKIFRWSKIVIIVYCSIGIALYYLQEKLLFHPVALPRDYVFSFNVPFKEINIPLNAKDNLSIIQFSSSDSIAKGVVIYFHGNQGNVSRYAKYAANFTKKGYEVLMPDYPGYGKTTGILSEENLYKQAGEVYKLARSKFKEDAIIIFGKSLGSGIATYLASENKCKRLILETPYYSIPDLLNYYAPIYPTASMIRFKIPTYKYLQDVKAPVTIFHGTDDGVVPYKCGAKLKKFFKPGDEFITIDKGTHNNLNDFPLFHKKIDSLL